MRILRLTLATLVTAVPISVWFSTSAIRPVSAQTNVQWPGFAFYQEFFGPNAYTDPALSQNLNQGMMTGLTFSPPVGTAVVQTTQPFNAGLMLRLPGAPQPSGLTAASIEQNRLSLAALNGSAVLWDLLPEWDQYGGAWVPQGRPRYNRLTRSAAHSAFLQFYETTYPSMINGYLQSPPSQRNYLLTGVTDNSPNVYDGYELGVEMQMLERGIDELGDLSTGVAFLRGAARQYNRAWGIDLSNWRTGNNSATAYSPNGTLTGGWSASYLRRHYYYSYLAGANLIQNEAASYRYSNGALNPFGAVTQEFANFALRRHPDLGQPLVNTALLISPDSGFDPKHGFYNQNDAVWYQDLPYSGGDTMMNQVLRYAYPNHWLHGLAPGAPFANNAGIPNVAQFQSFLTAALDVRPYEPMPNTHWGDQLDIITTRASADTLAKYQLIIMVGDVQLDPRLRSDLTGWVSNGGLLLMNSTQATADDQPLTGVNVVDAPTSHSAAFSRWLPDDPGRAEPRYTYSLVQPTSAEVWAVNENNHPLITANYVGGGRVLFTTPAYLEPTTKDILLNLGIQLLDYAVPQFSPVQITGAPVAYVVNNLPGKLVIGVFNHSATDWNGQIAATIAADPDQVMEYVTDQPVNYSSTNGSVTIQAVVPAFDLKVFALEYSAPANARAMNVQKKNRASHLRSHPR